MARTSPRQYNIPVLMFSKQWKRQQQARCAGTPAEEEEEFGLDHLMIFTRLLISWCWREQGFPAFPPPAPPGNGANGLVQEMLLGFDVGQGFWHQPSCAQHSVLSMTVQRKQAADGVASTWSITLQASPCPSEVG